MKLYEWIKFREYGDYTVVYDTVKGTKTIFEGIASDILNLLQSEISFEEIVENIINAYQVDEELRCSVEKDVETFLNQIEKAGMLNQSGEEWKISKTDANQKLVELCGELQQLEHVYFELTYRCNEKCIHCYEEHSSVSVDELSYEELCDVLDELRDMGVLEVTFTGGEVAVRKDFIKICAYASLLGFVVHIFTNGIAFTDKDIEELCQMHIADIAFSVYSMNPSVHDSITQVPGSFFRTMYALFAFKSSGIRTIIKTVVMKQNNTSHSAIVDFCRMMHIQLETSMQILATDMKDLRPAVHRLGDENQYYAHMLYEATTLGYGTKNVYETSARSKVCGLGQSLNVTPDGTVYPCNVLNIPLGSLRKQSVRDIWNSTELRKLQEFNVCNLNEQCRKCENLNYCLYCPGAVFRETGYMAAVVQDTCLIANAKRRVYKTLRERKEEPAYETV